MSHARLFHVDAFATKPFEGNPAMVCLLPNSDEPDTGWMQSLASEINLSETAFVRPLSGREEGDFQLRWFTPVSEVDLCGHATLASAHVLFQEDERLESVRFSTLSGVLSVARDGNGMLWMDFPKREVQFLNDEALIRDIETALGAEKITDAGRTASGDFFGVVSSGAELRSLRPDFRALKELPGHRGMMISARGENVDFVSRFFAPNEGIDEDPVTGSAHCTLAPYWAVKTGRVELTGFQCSARGGMVLCRVGEDRVRLGGRALTIYRGEIPLN